MVQSRVLLLMCDLIDECRSHARTRVAVLRLVRYRYALVDLSQAS